MFLFTTPNTTPPAQANPVVNAIRDGADKTGTGFDFLLKTAQRESALDPNAKARTSSATGLFQFIEQTWLSTLKSAGGKHGLQAYSDAIQPGESGRLTVNDPAVRDQIMALRKDPKVSAVMAGEFTQKNRDQLASAIGRSPTAGDLYIAHVLGARGATELIKAVSATPTRIAAQDFPEAAAANRGIFYDKGGQARTVQEVYGMLAASHGGAATTASATVATDAPVAIAAALAPGRAKGLIGLFSTEGSRGPVSENIARHWTTSRSGAGSASNSEPGQRFFPRVGAADKTAETLPATVATASILQDAPIPPERPASLSVPAVSKAALKQSINAAPAAVPGDTATVRPRMLRSPLDLRTFLNTKERS
jgi:hypothetical protein